MLWRLEETATKGATVIGARPIQQAAVCSDSTEKKPAAESLLAAPINEPGEG